MELNYFKNCASIVEVKKKYKELALKHHPDRGGDTATMQEIISEYMSILQNPHFSFKNEHKTTEQEKQDFIKYAEIIDKIVGLDGIIIEIMGDWIWISGNTYPHRQTLKETGFYFAPKKTLWYYRPPEYKSSNRKPKTIEFIRMKYGSNIIETKNEKQFLNL